MFEYEGRCSCGRVELRFESELAPEKIQPRSDAATCRFCREHDGVWISDPRGTLEVHSAEVTRIERTGSRQVAFHFCPGCGDLVYATLEDESSGRVVGITRIALFEKIRDAAPPVRALNFDGEAVEAARKRRLANWTPLRRS